MSSGTMQAVELSRREIDIGYVLDKLLEGKELNAEERSAFRMAKIPDVLSKSTEKINAVAEKRGDDEFRIAKYENPALIPKIFAGLYKYGGDALFQNLGFVKDDSFRVISFEIGNSNNIETKNVKNKEAFNQILDVYIKSCNRYKQITTDYDLFGQASVIKNEELRDAYKLIGKRRLAAFGKAKEENKAQIDVCMRVFDSQTEPYAVKSAKKLMDIGANVFDYDGGEKLISIYIAELVPDWQKRVNDMLGGETIKQGVEELGKKLNMPVSRIDGLRKGDVKPTVYEAEDFERLGYDSILNKKEITAMIYRGFTSGKKTTEEPQMHKLFYGIVFENWHDLFHYVDSHISNKMTPDNHKTENDIKAWL